MALCFVRERGELGILVRKRLERTLAPSLSAHGAAAGEGVRLLPTRSAVVANMAGGILVICGFFCRTESQLEYHRMQRNLSPVYDDEKIGNSAHHRIRIA